MSTILTLHSSSITTFDGFRSLNQKISYVSATYIMSRYSVQDSDSFVQVLHSAQCLKQHTRYYSSRKDGSILQTVLNAETGIVAHKTYVMEVDETALHSVDVSQ